MIIPSRLRVDASAGQAASGANDGSTQKPQNTPKTFFYESSAFIVMIGVAAAIGGALVAIYYHRRGLTLMHYDARGHLVVARRIFDSITPGWQQIGAVWLPLPHLLNVLPVQIDLLYRTGASAVALSIAAFAVATASIAWIGAAVTGSTIAGLAGAAVFALNPNVLYLQATPMTEPLLLALVLLGVAMLIEWATLKGCTTSTAAITATGTRSAGLPWPAEAPEARRRQACPRIGIVLALACLTRYEAWPVTVAALVAVVWTRWRHGVPLDETIRETARIAVYPAAAILAFAVFSRIVVGQWLVTGDFFVPENKALGDPVLAAKELAWGTRTLSGEPLLWAGVAGVAWLIAAGVAVRRHAAMLIAVALVAMAVVPWVAFVKGHPFRIRYMVSLIAVEAIGAAALAGAVPNRRGARLACAIAVLALAVYALRPLDASAPMVVEALWDRPNRAERARVTACLGAPGSGGKIMASMGSLGHYMQEASHAGFRLRDFLHEGNGDLWLAALDGPRPFAQWILIEEKAQGGDLLALRAREHPQFLDGYTRVCEGAGLALYARQNLNVTVNK